MAQPRGVPAVMPAPAGIRGCGAHSDQERIIEEELYRFVRFQYEAVAEVARKR